MHFEVNTYAGKQLVVTEDSTALRGASVVFIPENTIIWDGLNNKISFDAGGKRHQYNFLIADAGQYEDMEKLFEVWYASKVPFAERNWMGKTYILKPLTRAK